MPPHARRLSFPLLITLITALLAFGITPAHASPAAPQTAQQVTVLQIRMITARVQEERLALHLWHLAHLEHLEHLHLMHLRYLAALSARAAARQAAYQAQQAAYQAQQAAYQAPAQQAAYQAPAQQPAAVSTAGDGSFQACVIARESGGNAGAVNPVSGAGGLYGFLPSTWQSLGYSGLPEDASVAEQNAAFQQEYAAAGTSPWAPSDGC